jgi:hypothetical protein
MRGTMNVQTKMIGKKSGIRNKSRTPNKYDGTNEKKEAKKEKSEQPQPEK